MFLNQDEKQKTNHLKCMYTNTLGSKQQELEFHDKLESYDTTETTEI